MAEPARPVSENAAVSQRLPNRIFLITQADKPEEIRKELLDSAISDGWFNMLVNINTAIFAGLIALTANFGAVASLVFSQCSSR